MPSAGLFDGLEQDVAVCAQSIGTVLEKYDSSRAGKSLKAVFSNSFYHFEKSLWQGCDLIESESALLLKLHITARLDLDLNMLAVALYRAFRRALYCKCFNGIELAQMKQAGLYAYWLTKMHPIIIRKAPEDLEALSKPFERALQEINERFAFYIVRAFYKEEFGRELPDRNDYQDHFVHAAKYRSFTEDSMMLATESLGLAGGLLAARY
jgi:hypothetical protein